MLLPVRREASNTRSGSLLYISLFVVACLSLAQPPDPPAELDLLRDLTGRSASEKDSVAASLSSIVGALTHLPNISLQTGVSGEHWLLDVVAGVGNLTVDAESLASSKLGSHRLRLAALAGTALMQHGVWNTFNRHHTIFKLLMAASPVKPEATYGNSSSRGSAGRPLLPWFRALQFHSAKLLTAPALQELAGGHRWSQLWAAYDAQAAACMAPRAAPVHTEHNPFVDMVPNILHTAKTDGMDWWYRPLQAAVAIASFQRMAPNRLLLHSDVVPNSRAWERVRAFTSVRLGPVPSTVTRHSGEEQQLEYPAHRSDVLRARLLEEHGGVWMDWDVIPHTPHDALRAALLPAQLRSSMGLQLPQGSIVPSAVGARPSAVLAREKHIQQDGAVFYGYFGVAVMAAPRGSAFMNAWGEAQRSEYSYKCYTCGSTVAVTRMLQARPDWAVELPWRTWYAPGWEEEAVGWLMQPHDEEVDMTSIRQQTDDMHALHLFFSHGSWSPYREFDFLGEFSQGGPPSRVLHALTQDVFQYSPSAMLLALNTPAVLLRTALQSALCGCDTGLDAAERLTAQAAYEQAVAAVSLDDCGAAHAALQQVVDRLQLAHTLAVLGAAAVSGGGAHTAQGNETGDFKRASADEARTQLHLARHEFLPRALLGSDAAFQREAGADAGLHAEAVGLIGDARTSSSPDVAAILKHYVPPEYVLREFTLQLLAGSPATWLCGALGVQPSPSVLLLQARTTLALKARAMSHDTVVADVPPVGQTAEVPAAGAMLVPPVDEVQTSIAEREVEAWVLSHVAASVHAIATLEATSAS